MDREREQTSEMPQNEEERKGTGKKMQEETLSLCSNVT